MDKQTILQVVDAGIESVEVKEWGTTVYVRTFSGKARDKLDKFIASKCNDEGKLVDPTGIKVMAVLLSLCDENGKLIFEDGDFDALQEKNANAISTIYDASAKLNALGEQAEKKD
jgi:hypothetical protein